MQNSYKILWLEDSFFSIKRTIQEVENGLINFGYQPKINKQSEESMLLYIAKHTIKDYDLIVMAMDANKIDIEDNVLFPLIKANKDFASRLVLYSSNYDYLMNTVMINKLNAKTSSRDEIASYINKLIVSNKSVENKKLGELKTRHYLKLMRSVK